MEKKKSILLLISAILATLYSIFTIKFFFGGLFKPFDSLERIGVLLSLSGFIALPHIILTIISNALNWIGYIKNDKTITLIGGILYIISGFLFLFNIIFLLPSIVLSFIGYTNLKKSEEYY